MLPTRLKRLLPRLSPALMLGALALPLAAVADEVVQTPSGEMRLIETENFSVEIQVGGQVFTYEDMVFPHLLEQVGNVFLVFLATGGNACPGFFVWVDTSPGNVVATPTFGTCSEGYAISTTDRTLDLRVPSMSTGEGDSLFSWDGVGQVTETVLPLEPSAHPPGSDPRGWLGLHPAELLGGADWEELLLNGLTGDELADLRQAMRLSEGFSEQEGWIAAAGFNNYTDDVAAIALHPDGELLVALRLSGQEPQLWGESANPPPAAIREIMGN